MRVVLCILGLLSVSVSAKLRSGANPPVFPQETDLYAAYRTGGEYEVKKVAEVPRGALAYARWANNVNTTGWAFLSVTTGEEHADYDQAYAAGFLEGAVTHSMIWDIYYNTAINNSDPPAPFDNVTNAFLKRADEWIDSQIAQFNSTDLYWHQVYMIYTQMRGILAGYNKYHDAAAGESPLTWTQMNRITLDQGDIYDVQCLANISECATSHPSFTRNLHGPKGILKGHPDAMKSARSTFGRNRHIYKAARGHCTSMLKVTPGNADIFVGHTTWDDLSAMTRIWKVYDLKIKQDPQGNFSSARLAKVSMASYPVSLASSDDFVFNSNGIVAVSSEIFPPCPNYDVWKNIQPRNLVWEWVRNTLVMRLADSASDWARLFGLHQSSTYNNEWIIVDYKLFHPGQPLQPNTIWLVDQMPSLYSAYDITANVSQTSWFGSWNVQADPVQFDLCGWPSFIQDLRDSDGDDVADDYTHCCQTRAKLMGRLQQTVTTLEDFGRLMRHNDYTKDPESLCNCTALPYSACKAVSTRCDLMPDDGMGPDNFFGAACFGGYDSKVISSSLVKTMSAWGQSGPTYDNVPPFQFSKAPSCLDPPTGLRGLPDVWQMPWVEVQPF